MKKNFFEYNMHSLGHVDEIKKNSIIILDTNSLLNLYRYNKENREKFFEILDKVEDRLFLTNKSVEEFYKNRENILRAKSKFKSLLSEEISNDIKKVKNTIKNLNFNGKNSSICQLLRHETELKSDLIKILENTSDEIIKSIDLHINENQYNYTKEDPFLYRIIDLFEGKVNKKLSKETLNKIYKEGKERYKNKIPPGYEDLNKNKKPEPDCYGDLVIWKEMIEISKSNKANILFISDDTKEDWCEKDIMQNIGPRKELIREFYDETEKLFYSIKTSEFIKYISDTYNIVNTQDLEEQSEEIRKELHSKEDLDYNTKLSNLIVIFLKKFAEFENLILNISSIEYKSAHRGNFVSPIKFIRYLYNKNHLEKPLYEKAEMIIMIRNELVHDSSANISVSDITNYIETLDSIMSYLINLYFND